MTRVAADGYDEANAPRNNPLAYPGVWPATSVLIGAERVWQLLDSNGQQLSRAEGHASNGAERIPERLSASRVRLSEPEIDEYGFSTAVYPHLMNVLEKKFSVSVDARVPVLAIGSNAAPSQLRSKFHSTPSALLIPSVLATVEGIAVTYCSFVAFYGSVPATIIRDPGSTVQLAVQLLDQRQLAELDASESPSYRRVWLDEGVRVTLETGEVLPGVYAYVADRGYLADGDEPLRMRVPGDAANNAFDQRQLIEHLLQDEGLRRQLGRTPEAFVAAGQADKARVTKALQASEFSRVDNELFELENQMGLPVKRYGALMPIEQKVPNVTEPGVSYGRCKGTPDGLARGGLSVVRMPRATHERLGKPKVVEVSSYRLYAHLDGAAPTALAAVIVNQDPDADEQLIEVDQVLRMATGLNLGDVVRVRVASLNRGGIYDWLIGKPTYLSMRVTLADTSSAERDVVLMSGLSLQLLGLSSGDYLILEGSPDARGQVGSLRLKAFEAPVEVLEQRAEVTGGTWGARFPNARDALGVDPDLPLVFVDSEIRSRLGLSGVSLASVRARPSRLQQFFGEMREMLNVLAIAFISMVILAPSVWLGVVLTIALIAMSFLLILNKMKRKLSHQLKILPSSGRPHE